MVTIDHLAIPTADRPIALKRVLESYGRNLSDFGRKMNIIVVDQSNARNSRANRNVVDTFAREYSQPSHYIGESEKAVLCEQVTRSSHISEDMARFVTLGLGFPGARYGANRNAAMLHARTGGLLFVDDDTLCEPLIIRKTATDGVETPETVAWYDGPDEMFRAIVECEVDVIGEHERALGYFDAIAGSVRDELSRSQQSFAEAPSEPHPRVVASFSGAAGDCGSISPWWSWLRQSEDPIDGRDYLALSSRVITRCTMKKTVARVTGWKAMTMGIDDSAKTPLFPPCFRNEDYVYGLVRLVTSPNHFAAYLPHMIRHDPLEPRLYDYFVDLNPSVSSIASNVILGWYASLSMTAARADIGALGDHLINIGTLSESEFRDLLVGINVAHHAQLTDLLSNMIENRSQFPRREIAIDFVSRLRALSPSNINISDLSCIGQNTTQLAYCQKFFYMLGTMLRAEPCATLAG